MGKSKKQQIGSTTVEIDDNGCAYIDWGEDTGAMVLKDDRPAVALALLGTTVEAIKQLLDDLVEAANERGFYDVRGGPVDQKEAQERRDDLTAKINAIFGTSE